MSESNGVLRDPSPFDGVRPNTSRVSSASMMRSGKPIFIPCPSFTADQSLVQSSSDSPPSDNVPWSSAIGHAGTGKSGRVIERLQGDIDRLRREKQLLTTRLDETEKEKETLKTRNQSLEDRTSNYEQSHEASLRQLTRRERQVEELREELRKEKLRTTAAEAQAVAATSNEEIWRDQASQAKALAAQKEAEYDTIVACRKVDYDRHQSGLDKIKSGLDSFLRRQQEDLEKQKKLEIIAEQQRQTISQLEDLTRRLTTNFKTYRNEIDNAISELRQTTSHNDDAVNRQLDEMAEVTGRMRWVMNVEQVFNPQHTNGIPANASEDERNGHSHRPSTAIEQKGKRSKSPSKLNKLTKRKNSTQIPK
jgi:DNA repair exonuclease SbcCD ATPase subunit